jgi:HD-GYP domain-containing protein (c-di-GMP phosphodiesterase class II)
VSIADAYDAMIQDRPYKRAIGHDEALFELRRHSGTQFDPELVDVFIRLYSARPPIADHSLIVKAVERRTRPRSVPRRVSA